MVQLITLVGHGQPVNDLAVSGACRVHIHCAQIVRCMAICIRIAGGLHMLAQVLLPRKTLFCIELLLHEHCTSERWVLLNQFHCTCSSQVTMVGIFAGVQQVAHLHILVADTLQSPWALSLPPAGHMLQSDFWSHQSIGA